MHLIQPLDKLRRDLLCRGLPGDYVSRAVQELADHHADLVEADAVESGLSAEAAWEELGDVEQLGEELVRKYRARSFAGRHPLLTFLIAPRPTVVMIWMGAFFAGWTALFVAAQMLGDTFEGLADTDFLGATKPLPLWLIYVVHYAIEALPPAFCAWWFCRLARL